MANINKRPLCKPPCLPICQHPCLPPCKPLALRLSLKPKQLNTSLSKSIDNKANIPSKTTVFSLFSKKNTRNHSKNIDKKEKENIQKKMIKYINNLEKEAPVEEKKAMVNNEKKIEKNSTFSTKKRILLRSDHKYVFSDGMMINDRCVYDSLLNMNTKQCEKKAKIEELIDRREKKDQDQNIEKIMCNEQSMRIITKTDDRPKEKIYKKSSFGEKYQIFNQEKKGIKRKLDDNISLATLDLLRKKEMSKRKKNGVFEKKTLININGECTSEESIPSTTSHMTAANLLNLNNETCKSKLSPDKTINKRAFTEIFDEKSEDKTESENVSLFLHKKPSKKLEKILFDYQGDSLPSAIEKKNEENQVIQNLLKFIEKIIEELELEPIESHINEFKTHEITLPFEEINGMLEKAKKSRYEQPLVIRRYTKINGYKGVESDANEKDVDIPKKIAEKEEKNYLIDQVLLSKEVIENVEKSHSRSKNKEFLEIFNKNHQNKDNIKKKEEIQEKNEDIEKKEDKKLEKDIEKVEIIYKPHQNQNDLKSVDIIKKLDSIAEPISKPPSPVQYDIFNDPSIKHSSTNSPSSGHMLDSIVINRPLDPNSERTYISSNMNIVESQQDPIIAEKQSSPLKTLFIEAKSNPFFHIDPAISISSLPTMNTKKETQEIYNLFKNSTNTMNFFNQNPSSVNNVTSNPFNTHDNQNPSSVNNVTSNPFNTQEIYTAAPYNSNLIHNNTTIYVPPINNNNPFNANNNHVFTNADTQIYSSHNAPNFSFLNNEIQDMHNLIEPANNNNYKNQRIFNNMDNNPNNISFSNRDLFIESGGINRTTYTQNNNQLAEYKIDNFNIFSENQEVKGNNNNFYGNVQNNVNTHELNNFLAPQVKIQNNLNIPISTNNNNMDTTELRLIEKNKQQKKSVLRINN